LIGISEVDFNDGAVSSGIVEYSSHNSSDISLSLRVVEVTISGWSDSFAFWGGIDAMFL
jgi:hypothetical protein